jgi:hypothetical protein
MHTTGPLSRALALAGLLIAAPATAPAVMAAPADVALLRSYIGDWRGRGTLTGENTETVVCRLSLHDGNEDKVNYSGRCAIAGTNLSINGTLAYIDELSRFEAAMTSNASFSGIAVGKKQGDGVVFNLREREQSEGEDLTITAQIALGGGDINVEFQVVYESTGETIRANVPFSK